MTTDIDEEARVDAELETKAVVIRDGARGWRLVACFIEDAYDLLGKEMPDGTIPDEDSPEYEFVNDTADDLADEIAQAGYTTIWNDGYVIYKDLSGEAIDALAEAQ